MQHSFAVLVTFESSPDMLGVVREVVTPASVASGLAETLGVVVRQGVGPMVPVVVSVAVVDSDLDGRASVTVP